MAQLAEPIVSFLVENISKLLIEEGRFLAGVSEQAEQLQSKLRLMLSLLRDADARQDEDAVIREWISQTKDLGYEAENALETFAFKVASRKRRGIVNVLKRYSCILNECYMRYRLGSEIQNLQNRISDLTKSFQEYGMRNIMEREGPSSRQQQQLMRRTYSHVEEEDFVGLESDVKMLVEQLVNEDQVSYHKVVSICGMGGLGKTTIARKVYNHPDVRRHFHGLAWVCISPQWQTKDILQGILLKIIPEKREEIVKYWTDNDLVEQLYRVQQNNKCLIVLDDIWSTNAWECMKHAFPTGERGSKILLTTRNKNVAVNIGPNGFHHEPRLLSEDESSELLEKKAWSEGHSHDQSQDDILKLRELGLQMVKCCGGLPLAVVVLGGILATKHEYSEWKFVYQNVKSYLGKGESIEQQQGEVQKILALSYNDLPYQLKPCFLYLSIYPEDHDIETERLYHLWLAEGMVSKEHRIGEESTMDTAERYLGELVKRCMVQVKLKDEPSIRKFESCRLHDLMRDLCIAKANYENFSEAIDYQHGDNTELIDSTSSTSKFHRLVLYFGEKGIPNSVSPRKMMIAHVRSLTLCPLVGFIESFPWIEFNKLKKLRALTIEGLRINDGDKSPYDIICILVRSFKLEIGKLIHLRYLCFRKSDFGMLPSSLGNLEHLETLDLRGHCVMMIRDVLWKLKALRHLYLPDANIKYNCRSFCWKLRLVGLTKLEILENFSGELCEFNDLREFSNLQVLKAEVSEENEWEEIINCISNSRHLKEASLHFKVLGFAISEKWPPLLEKLFGSNLYYLYLDGDLCMLPEYKTNFFENLLELELLRSRIERDHMKTLEKLPNLQKLWLGKNAFVGIEMICSRMGFPQLRFLSLEGLDNLKEWKVENGAMAHLSHLEILKCLSLKMIPDGLEFITTLKQLVIRSMPEAFCNRIQIINGQEGEDFDKVRHVRTIHCENLGLHEW